ncbi:hypothetical protein S58_60310 [Bradyrhizobium oligotrophicum S58]|uniref:Uncharacterized protein n=1 Tax=Bradyrhizobium oligotrophicum S58 TaxID=1245469 RepID=M4ZDV5_9BRAD|nr:hypothetical protein [Bradyrhizobium oligotrophicum]BAM92007.1 hypothetical protein S58_60310 [Bradyrhizobium oligotrophicum S58]
MQVTLGVLAGAITRVEERRRWRIGAAEWTIVAHMDTDPSCGVLSLGEHPGRAAW